MKKLLILSGKGGTGKTTTAAAFIQFSNALAFADCDVDAPNLHLVSATDAEQTRRDYKGSQKARINPELCLNCGTCAEDCRFDAVKFIDRQFQIDEFACEGCGVCQYICPQNAIELTDDVAGETVLYSSTRNFATAKLKMGRGNSGKLVSEVKKTLSQNSGDAPLAIIDGSPGIGCPVISSISGVNLVLIVAEPSLSGISDLVRILKTAEILNTRVAVCVNKFDTSTENTLAIEDYCAEHALPFVGKIPYDKQASVAINSGKSIAEVDCPASVALRLVYERTMEILVQ